MKWNEVYENKINLNRIQSNEKYRTNLIKEDFCKNSLNLTKEKIKNLKYYEKLLNLRYRKEQ